MTQPDEVDVVVVVIAVEDDDDVLFRMVDVCGAGFCAQLDLLVR